MRFAKTTRGRPVGSSVRRRLGGRQLATGTIDLAASGVPDGYRDSPHFQPSDELIGNFWTRGRPFGSRRRVQRDQVHVHPAIAVRPAQHRGEFFATLVTTVFTMFMLANSSVVVPNVSTPLLP